MITGTTKFLVCFDPKKYSRVLVSRSLVALVFNAKKIEHLYVQVLYRISTRVDNGQETKIGHGKRTTDLPLNQQQYNAS